jgi:hypothetical protein
MVDRVALAAVIGGLLHVPGCGDPDTTFEEAVTEVSAACSEAAGPRRKLLHAAEALLSSTHAIVDITAQLAPTVARLFERSKENTPLTQSAGNKLAAADPHQLLKRTPFGDLSCPARV